MNTTVLNVTRLNVTELSVTRLSTEGMGIGKKGGISPDLTADLLTEQGRFLLKEDGGKVLLEVKNEE